MGKVITPMFGAATQEMAQDALKELLREGARKMLQQAVEAEVAAYIDEHANVTGADGRRLVVRNGYKPERDIQCGLGPISVTQPRVNDKRVDERGERQCFTSTLLPPYLRKTKDIEELIPWLYLKGVSTGDFSEALKSLLGANAPGLSASTVTRLKGVWEDEYKTWDKRSLAGKRYAYIWADGVYFKVRLDGEKQCILVIMGATADGKKELLAIEDGMRESALSWSGMLRDLIARGLKDAPELAIGDGALGFWAALAEVFPTTRPQRCWVHKTANVLNALPDSQHAKAKGMLHEIWQAATKKEAESAFDSFILRYQDKYEKATKCLAKDRDELLAFYDFPAEHWRHIRTTNPIESMFATVRLRTKRTKGCGSAMATLTMVFKLAQSAEHRWHRLNGHERIAEVIQHVRFVDGVRAKAA